MIPDRGPRERATRARRSALGLLLLVLAACAPRPRVWVFTAPWDAASDSAVAQRVTGRATLVSGWVALDTLRGPPRMLYVDRLAADSTRRTDRFLLVTSFLGDRFHPETVRRMAEDAALRATAEGTVQRIVRDHGYRGVVLDLEALVPADTLALVTVVRGLTAAARNGGAREIAIAVPALDTVAYAPRVLLPYVDRLVVMLYDQHWAGGEPGPVADRRWAREALSRWVALAGADRVVAAFPTYGYHWKPGAPTAVVGFRDVDRISRVAGVAAVRDSVSGSLTLPLGADGTIWLSDGPLLAQYVQDARALGVRTVALWRLGLEDPKVWTTLGVR